MASPRLLVPAFVTLGLLAGHLVSEAACVRRPAPRPAPETTLGPPAPGHGSDDPGPLEGPLTGEGLPDALALALEELAQLPEPGRTQRARELGRRTLPGGAPALDARWLPVVLEGARAHPGEARAWTELLRVIVAGPLAEADLDRLAGVLTLPELEPALLEVALTGLLPARSPLVLPWAEELAAASPSLARPLAVAAAGHAPLEEALALLVRLGGDSASAGLEVLVEREGALELAAGRYDDLVRVGLDARGRRRLVPALWGDVARVLGVATGDADPLVRAQAWLVWSVHHPATEAGVAGLVAAYEASPGEPLHVPPPQLLGALEALVTDGRGPGQAAALGLGRRMEQDPRLDPRTRERAARLGERFGPPLDARSRGLRWPTTRSPGPPDW